MSDTDFSPALDIKVQDLATLVAALNRFLMRLSTMSAFQEAGLGLAEWSALSVIAEWPGINNRQLANILGVSPQRINQVTDSLRASALVSINSSPTDARKKVISITPAGTRRLHDLNAKLQPKIAAALSKRPQLLSRTHMMINKTLMRIVGGAKPTKLPVRQQVKERVLAD